MLAAADCGGESPSNPPKPNAAAGSSASSLCDPKDPLCQPCSNDSDCKYPGHVCVLPKPEASSVRVPGVRANAEDDMDAGLMKFIQPRGECLCDTRACEGSDQVCSSPSGLCVTGCDELKPCAQSGMFCDVFRKQCFPESGSCDSDADCPTFDPHSALRASCVDHSCRLQPEAPVPISPLQMSAGREVPVLAPKPGYRFGLQDAVEFRYRPITRSTMLVVTRGDPDAAPLWWASSQDSAQTTLNWTQGHGVQGAQTDLPPPVIPVDTPLYLEVQAYERGALVGASAAIPFAVGKPYPKRGDACSPAPLSCSSPDEALACVLGVCMRVCASYADCAVDAAGVCVPPVLPELPWRVCR